MIKWALIFLVVGLIAGVLGFTGVAGASFAVAKILFFVAIAIFVVLLLLAGFGGGLAYFQFLVKPEMIKGFLAKAAPPPTTAPH